MCRKYLVKIIINITLLLFIFSCNNRIEKIDRIPLEFQGEWINEFGEFRMVITEQKILIYEIYSIGLDKNPLEKEIMEMYTVKRSKCYDCLNYGLEISFKGVLLPKSSYYLEKFHPRLNKFLVLSVVDSMINPDTDEREFASSFSWKRDDL